MSFDANDFRKPTTPLALGSDLLKDKFFLIFQEVGLSNGTKKACCGYTCSEELNTMLAIAMLVLVEMPFFP